MLIHLLWLLLPVADVKVMLALVFKVCVPLALADPVIVADEVRLDGFVALTAMVCPLVMPDATSIVIQRYLVSFENGNENADKVCVPAAVGDAVVANKLLVAKVLVVV